MENQNKNVKLNIDYTDYETRISSKFLRRKKYEVPDPGKVKAFIPGIITEIMVNEGQVVSRGQDLLILEAMKMKNDVKSPRDGKIKTILVNKNKMVTKNETLLEFE